MAVTCYLENPQEQNLHTDCLESAKAVLKSMHVNVEVFLLGSCGSLVKISETVNNAIQLLVIIQHMKVRRAIITASTA